MAQVCLIFCDQSMIGVPLHLNRRVSITYHGAHHRRDIFRHQKVKYVVMLQSADIQNYIMINLPQKLKPLLNPLTEKRSFLIYI